MDPDFLYTKLEEHGINFYTGVPDSLLKNFCAYVTDTLSSEDHIIAANEGGAVGIATGHYLATGEIPLVYMQNSGQGNTVNPLNSLVDQEVYSIPMLLLIGWRGEPGKEDAPQHIKQGRVTLPLLETLGIPYKILPEEQSKATQAIDSLIEEIDSESCPGALVVRDGTFSEYERDKEENNHDMSREDAISIVADSLNEDDLVVSTTGKASRELYEHREDAGQNHKTDFLNVGAMGHTSQIALGIANSKSGEQVYCIDGDGSVIMHMGATAIIGSKSPSNLTHIVINNEAHDSVGGQPTAGAKIDISGIAESSGYERSFTVDDKQSLEKVLATVKGSEGPNLIEVKVNKGARSDLGRPDSTPEERKEKFMRFLDS